MNNLILVKNGNAILDAETAENIAYFEKQVAAIKQREDELKAAILHEMECKGIVKLETPELTISYIAPTDRETFDSKEFRKNRPELYDEYVRITRVKSSVRIKVKP